MTTSSGEIGRRAAVAAAFRREKQRLGIPDDPGGKLYSDVAEVRATRRDRVDEAAEKSSPSRNFAVCAFSLDIDLNVHLIYRTLACFNGSKLFVVGSKQWFKGATGGLEKHVPIEYCQTPSELLQKLREQGYAPVSIEQAQNSCYPSAIKKYPAQPCFIVGNESYGLTDEILLNSELVVEIPQDGVHPCLNVGVSAGIVIFDYISKL